MADITIEVTVDEADSEEAVGLIESALADAGIIFAVVTD